MSDPVGEGERRLSAWRRDGSAIAAAVRARIDRRYVDAERASALAEVVADELAERGEGRRTERDRARWSEVAPRLLDPDQTEAAFRAVVDLYLDDIAGGFDARLYRGVMAILPRALDRMFRSRFTITGPIDQLKTLAADHTLVFAPTHSSHLDSILAGVAIRRVGLPATTFAAGKHMYRNAVLAPLMARLGAYRVDRGLGATLYKDVLKAYTAELLERGFHSVIFAGATRCRTNEVESQLKLGLLGTALDTQRPIAIIPVTISYQIVLEAPALIRHFLSGRAAERIGGDSSAVKSLLAGIRRLVALDEAVVVAFGDPIDPRTVASTPRIGAALTAAYRRDTVLFSTQVVGAALYELAALDVGPDIHDQVRRGRLAFPVHDVLARITLVVDRIQAQTAGGSLAAGVAVGDPDAILDAALDAWSSSHPEPIAIRRGSDLLVEDPGLVYYYRNRTAHLGT